MTRFRWDANGRKTKWQTQKEKGNKGREREKSNISFSNSKMHFDVMRKYVPNVRAYNIYFYYWHGFNIFNPMDRQQRQRRWQRPSFLFAFVHGTQYKTFTHFKIVYNFISFEVSLVASLLAFTACDRHIVSRSVDLWFLFFSCSSEFTFPSSAFYPHWLLWHSIWFLSPLLFWRLHRAVIWLLLYLSSFIYNEIILTRLMDAK